MSGPDSVGAVVNPVSGTGAGVGFAGELAGIFAGATVETRVTVRPAQVGEFAREQATDSDLLVSVGGDGTLREVVTALVDHPEPPPVFVVPAGRGNSVYRHLYGDSDWRALAGAIAEGYESVPLDVGAVTADPALPARRFVLGFTAGLFRSTVVHAERFDALPGRLAYLLGTARAVLGDDPVTAAVDVDGDRLFAGEARLVAVGGGRYRGSEFALFPDSQPGGGRLHVLVVEPVGARGAIEVVSRARRHRLRSHPCVRSASGTEVTITAPDGLPVEVDGTALETQVSRAKVELVSEPPHYATPTRGQQ